MAHCPQVDRRTPSGRIHFTQLRTVICWNFRARRSALSPENIHDGLEVVRNTGQQRNRPPRLGLEESRVRRGITLEEIADATKISRRFLIAIEAGDYGVLPGGVFSTSYIRQYAEATGFDAGVILEHYVQSCLPAPAAAHAGRAGKQPPQSVPKWAARFFSIG
ncbi:MAG: hypothetical protein C0506_16715 [Anaerolinea sp.]|nr:hypothetical protein [Anaerolinea sp.]